MTDSSISRCFFLRSAAAATTLATTSLAQSNPALPNAQDAVQLSQVHGPSEQDEKAPGPFLAGDERNGFAIVGLGRLSIDQILPAFGKSKYAKPVSLVSGDATRQSSSLRSMVSSRRVSTTMRLGRPVQATPAQAYPANRESVSQFSETTTAQWYFHVSRDHPRTQCLQPRVCERHH